ncbi:hypothetical protein P175DRAFT_0561114, partial [Aspergillus ochraceoroseus IBT 24754]
MVTPKISRETQSARSFIQSPEHCRKDLFDQLQEVNYSFSSSQSTQQPWSILGLRVMVAGRVRGTSDLACSIQGLFLPHSTSIAANPPENPSYHRPKTRRMSVKSGITRRDRMLARSSLTKKALCVTPRPIISYEDMLLGPFHTITSQCLLLRSPILRCDLLKTRGTSNSSLATLLHLYEVVNFVSRMALPYGSLRKISRDPGCPRTIHLPQIGPQWYKDRRLSQGKVKHLAGLSKSRPSHVIVGTKDW